MNASVNNRQSNRLVANSGFTLIELMVTIAVLAIIVSIAAPNINEQLAQNQIKATSTLIQTSISRAKAESAISRNSVTWTYNTTNKQITLSIRNASIANYQINDNSLLSFAPTTGTALVINKEGMINNTAGTAANIAIDVSDARASTNTQRIRVNNKRAFECSGTNC